MPDAWSVVRSVLGVVRRA